jgi:benzoyl-CoA 2,3-dioxygenase component B
MFTYFTDRDGKYQLLALAESGFDPLVAHHALHAHRRGHHMFVGETGVLRVVSRRASS